MVYRYYFITVIKGQQTIFFIIPTTPSAGSDPEVSSTSKMLTSTKLTVSEFSRSLLLASSNWFGSRLRRPSQLQFDETRDAKKNSVNAIIACFRGIA